MSKQQKTNASETLSYRQKLKAGKVSYRPTSRKAKVYRAFIEQSEEAAKKLAQKLGIKPATFRAWKADWIYVQTTGAPCPLQEFNPKPAKKTASKKAVKRKSSRKAA